MHLSVANARSKHDSKNVFAVGWGVAALTLLHVASVEPIRGAICLGLPLNKKHRPLRNVIGDIKCPVLLVIGTAARSCSTTDVESLVAGIPGDKRVIFIEGQLKFEFLTKILFIFKQNGDSYRVYVACYYLLKSKQQITKQQVLRQILPQMPMITCVYQCVNKYHVV